MRLLSLACRSVTALLACALIGSFTPALAETAPANAPRMWVIKDADSTVYLFGSIHLLKAENQWLTPALEATFDRADTLYLEVENIDDQATALALVMKHGTDPKQGLYAPYTPEQVTRIRDSLTRHGLNPDQMKPLKPWLVAMLLSIKQLEASGFDPNAGVDKAFMARARDKGIPVKGLERMEDQFLAFVDTTPEAQADYLWQTVNEENDSQALLNQLVTAWLAGDYAALETLLIADMKNKTPALYDTLIVRRNRNWIGAIRTLLEGSGTQFIVVGAGHLTGPDSVQTLLAAEGIEVADYDYSAASQP